MEESKDWEFTSGGETDSDDYVLDTNDDEDNEYFTSWDMPKFQIRKNMSKAMWKEEIGMAEVVENKGGMWRTMGIVRGGKTYFSIEETLFLVERGELSLSNANESSVPLKDIYKKIAEGKCGCCWESFEVYRHLRSLGYIIGRHGIPWSMKSTKDKCVSTDGCLDKKMITNQNFEEMNIIHKQFDNMSISDLKPDFDVYLPNSKFRKSSPGNPSSVLCVVSNRPPSKQEIEDLERRCNGVPLKLCLVDHGRVSFFSFNKVELPLLP